MHTGITPKAGAGPLPEVDQRIDAALPSVVLGEGEVIDPPVPLAPPKKTSAPTPQPTEEGVPWEPPPESPEREREAPSVPRRVRPGCRSGVIHY